jgi:pimeloyl-ACP methyl ester carboxylesterase
VTRGLSSSTRQACAGARRRAGVVAAARFSVRLAPVPQADRRARRPVPAHRPDYPGFGHTAAPAEFEYTFDRLADVVEGFVEHLGLRRFAMYVFDFGAPVGFRLATRYPEWISGLVVQNGNAYASGLSDGAREFTALSPDQPGAEATIRGLLTPEGTRGLHPDHLGC